MRERDFQASVLEVARYNGWRAFHVHDSRREVVTRAGERLLIGDRDAAGFPDLVLARPPQVLVRELKLAGEDLRPEQGEWLELLKACGVDADVWRPSDWDRIVVELSRPRRRRHG